MAMAVSGSESISPASNFVVTKVVGRDPQPPISTPAVGPGSQSARWRSRSERAVLGADLAGRRTASSCGQLGFSRRHSKLFAFCNQQLDNGSKRKHHWRLFGRTTLRRVWWDLRVLESGEWDSSTPDEASVLGGALNKIGIQSVANPCSAGAFYAASALAGAAGGAAAGGEVYTQGGEAIMTYWPQGLTWATNWLYQQSTRGFSFIINLGEKLPESQKRCVRCL